MQRTTISPDYYNYLRRQTQNILVSGGSEEDVRAFLEFEEHPMPANAVPPPAPRQVETPGMVQGLSMRALQGVTFGFGDEALGSLFGVLTGEGARGGRETYRKEMEAWTQQHKKLGFAAEMLGGLLSGGGFLRATGKLTAKAGMAAVPTTIGQRVVTAGAQGAAAGAVAGAGNTDGGLSERARSALVGGGAGLALGAGIVGAGRVLGTITRPVARSVTRGMPTLQAKLPGVGSPEMHARELVARALHQDGISADAARLQLTKMARTGSPVTLADLGGDATMRLAGDAVAQRTPAKQKLVEQLLGRQSEQGTRLTSRLFSDIFRSERPGLSNAYHATEALSALRKSMAQPYYQEAFEQVVQLTPRMQRLLKHPKFRAAYNVGRNIANDEDLAGIGHGLKVPPLPTAGKAAGTARGAIGVDDLRASLVAQGFTEAQIAQKLPAIPGQQELTELPVRALDYMKRGLDVVIEGGLKSERPTLDRQAARTLRALLGEVLDEADTQVPAYATARSVYRGLSEVMDAVDVGREFLKKAPEIVRRELSELGPAERDFYRLGAAQSLYEKVAASGETTDVAKRFFGGRLYGGKSLDAERLRALFPDAPDVADDFMRKVAAESRLSVTTGRVARAPRGGLQQQAEMLEGIPPAVRATPGVMVLAAARSGVIHARTGFTRDVSDELATLFSKGLDDPAELDALLDVLGRVQTKLGKRGSAASRTAVASGMVPWAFN